MGSAKVADGGGGSEDSKKGGELDHSNGPRSTESTIAIPTTGSVCANELPEWAGLNLGNHFRIITRTDQIWEFQTQIRDVQTPRSYFTFVADRLIRTVIEEGLNQLPYTEAEVTTPTGQPYKGLRYQKGNCGVSIVRSGEAMEKALQDCCRSMRIGKILVDSDTETHEARVIFAKFPSDIAQRKVLLLYPIMRTGNKVCKAVNVLIDHKVPEKHIILINLFCTPDAAKRIVTSFPNLNVLTTELHEVTPNHFGERYFGTEHSEY